MAHTILLKRSDTANAAAPSTLDAGELAINTADEKIYFKNKSNVIKSLSSMSDLTTNLVTISSTQSISGTKTFSANAIVANSASIRFNDNGSNYVGFAGPTSALTVSTTYRWPDTRGNADDVLTIDTSPGSTTRLKWSAPKSSYSSALTLSAQSELRFADQDSSTYAAFKAPVAMTNNNVYTLPATVGAANQVLAIDTLSGNDATLKWATVSTSGSSSGVFDIDGGDSATYTGVPDLDGGTSAV